MGNDAFRGVRWRERLRRAWEHLVIGVLDPGPPPLPCGARCESGRFRCEKEYGHPGAHGVQLGAGGGVYWSDACP